MSSLFDEPADKILVDLKAGDKIWITGHTDPVANGEYRVLKVLTRKPKRRPTQKGRSG
jgi:hypothetical protein